MKKRKQTTASRRYDVEVFDYKAKEKRAGRRFYRNLILRSVSSLIVGLILTGFLKAGGFPMFLMGFLLCVFSGIFVACIDFI